MNPRSRSRFHLRAQRYGGQDGEASRPAMLFGVAAAARIVYLLIFRPRSKAITSRLPTAWSARECSAAMAFHRPHSSRSIRPFSRRGAALRRSTPPDSNHAGLHRRGRAALLYRLALALTSSRRTATAAGLMFALHPLLIRQAAAATDLASRRRCSSHSPRRSSRFAMCAPPRLRVCGSGSRC